MSSKRSIDSPMKCAGSSPGRAMLSMPRSARVDHRAQTRRSIWPSDDVLASVGEIDLALPGHYAENVERQEDAGRMESRRKPFSGSQRLRRSAAGRGAARLGMLVFRPSELVDLLLRFPGLRRGLHSFAPSGYAALAARLIVVLPSQPQLARNPVALWNTN